ncbi:MAG: sporulation initiation factor Spo0A C-terminal domain-containing protein [Firmicutes bacterium]|nr:sporulation initiation factor Spo0A C-terminal domain-containing protein [Bacillota bacterium]
MRKDTLASLLRDNIQIKDLYKLYEEDVEEQLPLEKRVSILLYELSLSPSYKGYKYLKDAIMMLCEDESNYRSFTKNIYPALAKKHNTTSQNIEKNIRFAIKKIYESNTETELERHLGKNPLIFTKTSNVKFVTFCAEKLRLER